MTPITPQATTRRVQRLRETGRESRTFHNGRCRQRNQPGPQRSRGRRRLVHLHEVDDYSLHLHADLSQILQGL